MIQRLRIFMSSPGDVDNERRRAALVIGHLKRDFAAFFDVTAVLWEYFLWSLARREYSRP